MLNDKTRAEMDQATAMIAETWPAMLWQFFAKCKAEGFNDAQALTLTCRLLANFRPAGSGE